MANQSSSPFSVKVLHNCLVSPPPGSVPTTHIPLSFFDLFWLRQPPTRRVFFFEFPDSTAAFTATVLPSLKQSLSLTLQHFFPFCGNFILPPQPHNPHLLYTPQDSVHVTIAESDPSHFQALIPDRPKDARDVYVLFQDWPETRVLLDGTQVLPLLTLQITIFPFQGLSIGASFLHVAADGPSLHHFFKSWASISTTKHLHGPLPFHHRTLIQDPHGFEPTFLRRHWSLTEPINFEPEPVSTRLRGKARATFTLSKSQVERLKSWANSQIILENDGYPPHFSTFVVTCSLVWASFVTSRDKGESGDQEDEACCFAFAADCRNRGVGYSIPLGYFGNCLSFCLAAVKRRELLGGDGIMVGMKAIGRKVREVESEPFKDIAEGLPIWNKMVRSGAAFAVAGSPRLGAYGLDFGWGAPIKTEVVHIDSGRLFSLGECRDEKGGVEIGLALDSAHMARFVAVWEQNLNSFCG